MRGPDSPTTSSFPVPAPGWVEVARLCRRICDLVERGEITEADRLRTGEFAAAVNALRAVEADGTMFATAAERLVHATLLADVLAPLLAERLKSTAAVATPTSPIARIASPAVEGPARVRPATSGNIADFIDQMLTLERPAPAARDQRAS